MKQAFFQKKLFILNSRMKVLQMKTTSIAQTVWKQFHMESMKDYHNLYNLSDVILLTDIFENFRNICMNHYGQDPAWYFSAPGLAWDAALKMTKVQLELPNDADSLLMIESGIRGGIAKNSTTAMLKTTTNILQPRSLPLWNLNSSHIYIVITFMVGQCQNNFQHLDLNG